MCCEAVVYVPVWTESVGGVTEDPFGFRRFGSYDCEDGCPKFEYAVHECNGSIVGWVVGVFFVGFVDEFGGADTPLLGCVAVSGHELE